MTAPATPPAPPPWSRAQTIDLLNADPLPATFTWPHKDGGQRPVIPSHTSLRGGYGKWLAEGPQFPGLFELITDILADADQSGADTSWLASASRDPATAPDFGSWSGFIAAELGALRTRHAAALTDAEPLANQLRRLRTRPTDPAAFF